MRSLSKSSLLLLLCLLPVLYLSLKASPVYAELQITAPGGDSLYRVGQNVEIRWSSSFPGIYVTLDFSADGGATWNLIGRVPDSGRYSWVIPPEMEGTSRATIRLTRLSKPPEQAESERFTIVKLLHEAPFAFRARPRSCTEILLEWADNSEVEDALILSRMMFGEERYTVIAHLPPNTTEYADGGLRPGTVYYYAIVARSDFWGDSPYAYAAATTPPLPVIEPEPTPATYLVFFVGSSDYGVNGIRGNMDTVPVIRQGRTLLPIRYVIEPLGGEVAWDEGERKVTVMLGEKTIELWIDQPWARVNGVREAIDPDKPVVPVILPPGRTMLPLRFVAETLGCRVDWDPADQTVQVIYPAP